MVNYYKTARQLTAAVLLSLPALNALAQTDAAVMIKAGKEDANTLMNAYAGPMLKSFGAGLNAGWFQTAKPHGLGGFDITVSTNLAFAPSADQSFDVSKMNFNHVRLKAGESSESPTIFGDNKVGPEVEVTGKSPFTNQDTAITSFNLPQGIGVNIFPMPTAQLAVGVGFGTEIAVRFVPTINISDAKIGMFGFAVKHDVKQWIPGIKELPFDLSAMFGYTSMNTEVSFKGENAITPEKNADGSENSNIYYANASGNYDNQKMELKSKGWTTNVLLSKKLGPFTPYLGVGYQKATTELNMTGIYPVTVPNTEPSEFVASGFKTKKIQDFEDPVIVKKDHGSFRATAGFRLKFTVVTFHADYTFAEYNVASVGLGINLQSIVPFKM